MRRIALPDRWHLRLWNHHPFVEIAQGQNWRTGSLMARVTWRPMAVEKVTSTE